MQGIKRHVESRTSKFLAFTLVMDASSVKVDLLTFVFDCDDGMTHRIEHTEFEYLYSANIHYIQ